MKKREDTHTHWHNIKRKLSEILIQIMDVRYQVFLKTVVALIMITTKDEPKKTPHAVLIREFASRFFFHSVFCLFIMNKIRLIHAFISNLRLNIANRQH